MNDHRAFQLLCPHKHVSHAADVMPIHRAKICKAQFLKQNVRYKRIFYSVLYALQYSEKFFANERYALQPVRKVGFEPLI